MPLLFNPENDLALGVGCRHYTPPPRVCSLHRAGGLMPVWWAAGGEQVVAPDATPDEVEWLRHEYGLEASIGPDGEPRPWGWSEDAARQFIQAGVSPGGLPSSQSLERMRQLSHRRTSVEILRMLGCGDMAGREGAALSEMDLIAGGGLFLKSPWSCSGRGVFSTRGLPAGTVASRVAGIIHRQGSVMVEREFDRVRDFAALFTSDGVKVDFVGWSVFATAAQGAYTGNLVAPQDTLADRIGHEVDIQRLVDALTVIVAPHYTGPLGVDMMIYRDGGRESVHPCIELNLRMTMGFVALEVQKRLRLDSPRLIGWEFGRMEGVPLLKPREGFALTLR